MPTRFMLALATALVVSSGCDSPLQPNDGLELTIDRDSIEMSGPGVVRVGVSVERNGSVVFIEDSVPTSVYATGPFTTRWDPKNKKYYRNLEITATAPGTGSVIVVAAGGKSDTVALKASAVSFRTVSVAAGYACGLAVDDRAWCWGDNGSGQLGVNTVGDCVGGSCQYGGHSRNLSPLPVSTKAKFSQIAAGGRLCVSGFSGASSCGSTCALDAAGVATCWGGMYALQALTTLPSFQSARASPSGPHTISLATCGLGTDSRAYCFERTAAAPNGVATETGGGLSFTSFSAARTHACGVVPNGDIYCWGSNERGTLGTGTIDAQPHPTPERVNTTIKFTSVETSESASCAIAVDGAIYCWGQGYSSSGANPPPACPGSNALCQSTPRLLEGSGSYVSFSLSQTTTTVCGLTAAGAVSCWSNHNVAPVSIPIPQAIVSIGVGAPDADANGYFPAYACGVSSTNVAWCWNSTSVWKVGQQQRETGHVAGASPRGRRGNHPAADESPSAIERP